MSLDWRTIRWDDWSYSGVVSDRIAEILGWELSQIDRGKWWDPYDKQETGLYVFNARDAAHFFDPLNDVHEALFAAARLADRRHLPFRLERLSDGQWRASFSLGGRNDEISGIQQIPCKAICEAILKVNDVPNPNSLFRKKTDHAAPPR